MELTYFDVVALIDDLREENANLTARIAELEAESERLTVHSDIERQDDKSPNDTQTQTIVYGKEREE
jgi:BMFP domain-containing protein YqiC